MCKQKKRSKIYNKKGEKEKAPENQELSFFYFTFY